MKRNMVPRKLGAAVLILTLCLSLMVTGAWARVDLDWYRK